MNNFDYIGVAMRASVFIAGLEGLVLTPYNDIKDIKTVCYGQTGEKTKKSYTKNECDAIIYSEVMDTVLKLSYISFDTAEQLISITSFVYNIGFPAFNRSSVRKHLMRGEWDIAIQKIARYVYITTADGKKYKVKGLVNRRKKEQDEFYKGVEKWR